MSHIDYFKFSKVTSIDEIFTKATSNGAETNKTTKDQEKLFASLAKRTPFLTGYL